MQLGSAEALRCKYRFYSIVEIFSLYEYGSVELHARWRCNMRFVGFFKQSLKTFFSKLHLVSSTKLYMGVFGLVQTRGSCLDGVIRPLDLCVPLLPLLKGKVITSSFFYMCLPNGVGVKNVKGIKGVK